MKIAMVYDAAFPWVKGGGERRYYEIARELRARHEIHIVSWRWWDGPNSANIDGIFFRGVGAPPALYGPDGRRRTSEAVQFAARIKPLLLREHFDIVDCASVPFLPLFTGCATSRLRGARFVATWFEFWDNYWLRYLGGARGRAARFVERAAARIGDAHIAISATTAERMAPRRPAHIPVHVIEPGVDLAFISAAGQPAKAFDVVSAGRLNAQKNLPLLLHALAVLKRAGTPATCIILSDGPERRQLEELARALDLAGTVRFAGRIDDDREFYSTMKSARVLAWPSQAEGFGITPLEAMACGLPVVTLDSPFSATTALVRESGAGVVSSPDPAAFAGALRSLLDDDAALQKTAQAALARAVTSSWKDCAAAVERVYLSLAHA